jgi:chemotaxis protein histidine kinase CheA
MVLKMPTMSSILEKLNELEEEFERESEEESEKLNELEEESEEESVKLNELEEESEEESVKLNELEEESVKLNELEEESEEESVKLNELEEESENELEKESEEESVKLNEPDDEESKTLNNAINIIADSHKIQLINRKTKLANLKTKSINLKKPPYSAKVLTAKQLKTKELRQLKKRELKEFRRKQHEKNIIKKKRQLKMAKEQRKRNNDNVKREHIDKNLEPSTMFDNTSNNILICSDMYLKQHHTMNGNDNESIDLEVDIQDDIIQFRWRNPKMGYYEITVMDMNGLLVKRSSPDESSCIIRKSINYLSNDERITYGIKWIDENGESVGTFHEHNIDLSGDVQIYKSDERNYSVEIETSLAIFRIFNLGKERNPTGLSLVDRAAQISKIFATLAVHDRMFAAVANDHASIVNLLSVPITHKQIPDLLSKLRKLFERELMGHTSHGSSCESNIKDI